MIKCHWEISTTLIEELKRRNNKQSSQQELYFNDCCFPTAQTFDTSTTWAVNIPPYIS